MANIQEFNDRFFLAIITQRKTKDFASSIQGGMIVKQHATKFMELGMFAPHLILKEEICME